MRKVIIRINKWYDSLPDPKRSLFFLIFVVGSLILTQYLTYAQGSIWAFPIWASSMALFRVSYVFINWFDDYKNKR